MEIPSPPLTLAARPTPVEPLSTVSDRTDADVYVKRDDRTAAIAQGNKVRKLEYLLGDALETGADVVVTGGGVQSNHCRATAVLARRLGLDARLLLAGDEPAVPDGNLLLDRLVGATVEYVDAETLADGWDTALDAAADRLAAAGHTPYVIPLGGSTPRGVLGYVRAYTEIDSWTGETGVTLDRIVVPLGTGGSTAGLLAGSAARDGPAVVGIDVTGGDLDRLRTRVIDLARDALGHCGVTDPADAALAERVTLRSNAGPGYAEPAAADLETIATVGRTEGIVLDPTYTAKAFRAYRDSVRAGETSLFVHTGGSYSLFPHRDALCELLER